jgi:hypothetical protein
MFLVGFVLLDLWFYMYVFFIVVCPFVLFLLAIVLSVLLRYTVSDCPFGIFKHFLLLHVIVCNSILESVRGVEDFVICLEIKSACFNAEKLVMSFKVSAKNSLTFIIQSMDPVEYLIVFFSITLCFYRCAIVLKRYNGLFKHYVMYLYEWVQSQKSGM